MCYFFCLLKKGLVLCTVGHGLKRVGARCLTSGSVFFGVSLQRKNSMFNLTLFQVLFDILNNYRSMGSDKLIYVYV
jgi:hypothetical protein